MSEDSYRQLVRAGLAPLVEEVPDGPEWAELNQPIPITPKTARMVPGWVIAVGAAAVVIAVFGFASLLSTGEEPSTVITAPPATTPSTLSEARSFVPSARAAEGMTYLPLTLLDGSHLTLAYPEDLDLTSEGVEVQTVGSLKGAHSRVIGAHYGAPESFITRIENNAGPGTLAARLPGAGGGIVERWEFPEEPIAYLVYDFDPWTVYIWDGMGGGNPPMGEEAQNAWGASLFGGTYATGFLVLNADPPLELVEAANDPGPDGPDIRVDGSSGSLLVFVNDCDRMTRLDEEAYGSEVFAFCDEPTNTLFFVAGDAEVQERIHQDLLVNPPPPGVSTDKPPILEQTTDSHVYFRTDTHLTVVDIDGDSVTVHELPELAPGDALYLLVRRGEELVFYGETELGAAVYALDPTAPTSPVLIDEAWFFIPSAAENRVWLAILNESSPETVRALKAVREVTVDGVVTTDDIPPPDGRWPVAAVDAGLVFQGDQILEVWDPETQEFVDTLPGPFPVAVWRNRIVTCGQCNQLNLIDLEADTRRTVDIPVGVVSVNGYGGAFSPDGRFVAVLGLLTGGPLTSETGLVVVLVDFEAGTTSVVPGTVAKNRFTFPQVAWSSDGEWLFMGPFDTGGETGELRAYRPGDDSVYRVPIEIANEYFDMAAD